MSFASMWTALGPIGRHEGTGGYRRFAWSREDVELREWFAGECASRGMPVVLDRAGSQWAWWGDPDAAVADGRPGIVTGSHLDSVPDGGAFDGPLGVVSAFAAIDALRDSGFQPSRPIGVVNFVDEEGARFGVACAGSRLITGALDPDRARGLTDIDGMPMAEALVRAGQDAGSLGPDPETLRRVGVFVELHVEQGRTLSTLDTDAPVALGSSIWPHGRWRIDFPGEANHAGTTALDDRKDAMLGLARLVLDARSVAAAYGTVATVGKVVVEPGGVNAIPSSATAWLDARGADASAVRATVDQIVTAAGESGADFREESWTDDTSFDENLLSRLQSTLQSGPQSNADPVPLPVIGTGAGHDAGVLAQAGIPTGMLFVRNPTGVSHSPAEWADEPDCLAGVDALVRVLADLAGPVP